MNTRAALTEELRLLEGSMSRLSREQLARVNQLHSILQQCKCRQCGKLYSMALSRADLQGFCSAKCQHAKAKACGYRKGGRSEYNCLKAHGEVGSDFTCK